MRFAIKHAWSAEALHSVEIPDEAPEQDHARLALRALIDSGTPLKDACFINADFKNSHLKGVDFSHVRFQGCNFQSADLRGAKFDGSHVSDCCFRYADLRRASFNRAKLYDGTFHMADMDGANLASVESLWGMLGNGDQIVNVLLPRWLVTMTKEFIQIGCQKHTPEQWGAFGEHEIEDMAHRAWAWWTQYREVILLTHATMLPHWVANEQPAAAA